MVPLTILGYPRNANTTIKGLKFRVISDLLLIHNIMMFQLQYISLPSNSWMVGVE